jgi:hypothetical protein
MRIRTCLLVLFLWGWSCTTEKKEKYDQVTPETAVKSTFNKEKWSVKEGEDYPYRAQMLEEIVYNDTIRTLHKNEILALLGEPDRTNEGHLYYLIAQKRLGFWTLHSKTLVIKLSDDDTIDWIKIHE